MPTTHVRSMRGQRETTERVLDAVSSALFLPYVEYAGYAIYAGVRCTPFVPLICPFTAHRSQVSNSKLGFIYGERRRNGILGLYLHGQGR